jgi:hypothetical protein
MNGTTTTSHRGKKEGGLHQNRFDIDGKLKGSARFIPDDGSDAEPLIVTEMVYVPWKSDA